jgi:hypothetical protein
MYIKVYDAPFRPGWWWMNNKNAYGWEVVRVIEEEPAGTLRIECAGICGSKPIPSFVTEWVKINAPDVN